MKDLGDQIIKKRILDLGSYVKRRETLRAGE